MTAVQLSWVNALIVDDSHAILNFSGTLLKQHFAVGQLQCKNSAVDALEILKSNKNINLLLLDLNMPEMDGIQFLRELAAINYRGFLVIMSGVAPRIISTVEELAKRLKLNYLGALLKPLDVKDFEVVLNKIGQAPIKKAEDRQLKIYEIIRAIKNEQLEVYYQPQINLHTNKVAGFEVLVRLDHPTLGIVSPNQFLEKIEHSDLMVHMTFIILRKAFRDWHGWGKPNFKLAINVCPYTLQRQEFVDELMALIEEYQYPVAQLCIEITETTLADDGSNELQTLSRLNMRGIELALDDFGQDHASIERLQNLPINILKLDKSFFLEDKNRQGQVAIIESCLALAKRLHMSTVAEGIEQAEQWRLCSQLGCDIAQGYYISKPLQQQKVMDWIDHWGKQTD